MMDSEDTRSQEILGYDEKTETWFVHAKESSGRLILTRQSLARLVELYNRIHKGRPLQLIEQRELRRIEESRKRHSEALRDIHLLHARRARRRPTSVVRRIFGALLSPFRRP